MDWEHVRPGVARKAFSGAGATLSLNRLMPGHSPNPHAHPHEQIVYIMEGEVDFFVGGEAHQMGPGSLLVVPPNIEHYAIVRGTEPVLNLDVFTPKRTEYAS